MFNTYRFPLALGFIALAAVSALADELPDPKPQPKPEPKAEGNKAPWTAKEIHDDWLKGKVFNYDVETEDGKGNRGWWEVDNVTETDFTMSQNLQEKGKEALTDKPRKRMFEEYIGGLERQIKDAAKTEDSYAMPDGVTYECTVFTIEKKGAWQKFWLSKSVPGVPVKMERETKRGDKRDYECWTLTSHDILRIKLPWTPKELAEKWKDGASFKYSLESDGKAGWMQIVVSEVSEEGFTSTESGEFAGEKEDGKPRKYTWEKFMREMAPPKYGTTESTETIETKAGKFECKVYTYSEKNGDSEMTTKCWFAKEVTGPWVKMTMQAKGGEKSMSSAMELLEFKVGK
ncbi:MAG: hypothetical protein IT461_15430 [Planctomycetes bacterium]|nr:hypothetical protein [Planctomycetota bacterium]